MNQAITKLAAEMAERINETKIEGGYTIVCTHLELRRMVEDAIGTYSIDVATEALCDFYEEMECEHNLYLTVSQYDDVVLDEREEV